MFDLISSQYGWTDDQILDLLPLRLQRIAEAIMLRQEAEFRQSSVVPTASTRAIVGAVQGAAGNKRGAKAAEKIQLLKGEQAPTGKPVRREVSTEQAIAMFGDPAIPMQEG